MPTGHGRMAIALSRRFQPLRQLELLLTVEQRDGSHLPQVKPERIVRGLRSILVSVLQRRRLVVVEEVKTFGSVLRVVSKKGIRMLVRSFMAQPIFGQLGIKSQGVSFRRASPRFNRCQIGIPFHRCVPKLSLFLCVTGYRRPVYVAGWTVAMVWTKSPYTALPLSNCLFAGVLDEG